MSRNRRRQIVVNKALQSRIVFATAWAPGLCLAGTSLLLGVFCARLYNEALQADVSFPSILPVYMLFSALRFSHRIAGPMYNVGKTLQRFRDGDADAKVILREHDYLVEIQDHVNAFLDWLRAHPPQGYVPMEKNTASESEAAGESETQDADADVEGAKAEETTPAAS